MRLGPGGPAGAGLSPLRRVGPAVALHWGPNPRGGPNAQPGQGPDDDPGGDGGAHHRSRRSWPAWPSTGSARSRWSTTTTGSWAWSRRPICCSRRSSPSRTGTSRCGGPGGPDWAGKAAASVARDLMTVAVVAISPDATVAEAARRMHTAGVKRLPVVDRSGRLVGIVSRGDLLKVFDRSDQDIRREIIEDVIVGEFMMAPSRFFLHVNDGVVVLQGRVERRSLQPYVVRAVQGSRAWSGSRTTDLRPRRPRRRPGDDLPGSVPDSEASVQDIGWADLSVRWSGPGGSARGTPTRPRAAPWWRARRSGPGGRGQQAVGRLGRDLVGDQAAQRRGHGDPAVADGQVQPLQPRQRPHDRQPVRRHRPPGQPPLVHPGGGQGREEPGRLGQQGPSGSSPGLVAGVSWVRSPTRTDPSARWRRCTAGPGPPGR